MTSLKPHLAALWSRFRGWFWNPKPLLITAVLLIGIGTVGLIANGGSDVAAPVKPDSSERAITQLLDDAKHGHLAWARVNDQTMVVRVQYLRSPGDGTAQAPSPKAGDVVDIPVIAAALPQVIATLTEADVPVHTAGSTAHTDPATGTTVATPGTAHDPVRTRWNGAFIVTIMVGVATLIGAASMAASRRDAAELAARRARLADKPGSGTGPGSAGAGAAGKAGKGAAGVVEPATVPDTRFADVAGCTEAKADLEELVLFLKDPDRFTRTGAKAPKGALLCGPPGTGKTLLARAVAGEAGVPLFATAGSDFVEMYVGVGAKRVRELFAEARKHERAIIFIDEIDAVARKRSANADNGQGETEGTLIALLNEMDGFTSSNVIVLAATNRADILDEAITRPGRLDRKVEVPNPDRRGREEILAVHCRKKPLADDVDLTYLARRTPGFSGAQLAALVNEACLEAVRADQDVVTAEHFDHAVATIAMGRARTSALVTDYDRRITAWHEAGHTLAAYLQADADDPVQVTIVPRGPAGGVTWMSGNDDSFLPRRKAHANLVTALAGRAAEEALLGGEFTQGASGDLQSATQTAFAMAAQYGMTRLGYQVRGQGAANDAKVQEVVEELLGDAHAKATALLGAHREFLVAVAEKLLEEETLTLADIEAIGAELGMPRHVPVPVPDLPEQVRARRVPEPVRSTATTPVPVPAAAVTTGPVPRRRAAAALVPLAASAIRRRRTRPAPAAEQVADRPIPA